MGPRPARLDLSSDGLDQPPKMFAPRDLPSPRAGEIPPALSPLDAFAMHSRMLAKKFEEEAQNGRRMSRLNPAMVAKEMSSRPGFFRSLSNESKMSDVGEEDEEKNPLSARGLTADTSSEKERPTSHYPTLDRASLLQEENVHKAATPFFDAVEEQRSSTGAPKQVRDYFGVDVPRASSPEPVDSGVVNVQAPSPGDYPSLTNSIDTISSHPRTMTNDSQRSQRSQASERAQDRGLAPPQSPRFPKSPRSFQSIRSVPPDSGDEDGSQPPHSSSRKFSGSSGMSRPQSPFSPWMHPVHRSPSMTSEYSINGSQQLHRPAPSFSNFSRPLSSSGSQTFANSRPSFESRPSYESRPDVPHRQASAASSSTGHSSKSPLSRHASGDDVEAPFPDIHTPALVDPSNSEHTPTDRAETPGGSEPSSYIYAKYALPRGRVVDRNSKAFRDSWIQNQFNWDKDQIRQQQRQNEQNQHERTHSENQTLEARGHPSPAMSDMGRPGRTLTPIQSEVRSRSADPSALDRSTATHRSSPSVKTESTDRTIRATPLHQRAPSAELTPEEHLDIGLAAHDRGETNKSTYHLRLAAIAGVPTGMLMYALACRHGWGMRPNQEEGVKWLRKAIASSELDAADAEEKLNGLGSNSKLDPAERKRRKAQYALAIYELGISSMNGWGCTKDKVLALRCYETAGSLGDADALMEAGFCYANGVGCKKDLKKAASLYRRAEKRGASMAGQSWIYKPKYMDDEATTSPEKEKKRPDTAISKEKETPKSKDDKPAGRARSRSIWGRSKKEKPPAMPE